MNSEKQERAIRIIQALMQKTVENGCTPGEAAKSLAKVQELLTLYQIDLMDIEKKTFNEKLFRLRIDTGKKNRDVNESVILNVISKAYHCQCIVETNLSTIVYSIMGHESDVETVKSVFFYVMEGLNKSYKREVIPENVHGKTYRNSYFCGASISIHTRLEELNKEQIQEWNNTGNALMVVKANSLIEIKAKAVEKFVGEQFNKTRKMPTSNTKLNKFAFENGKIAGNNVEFNRKLN